MRVLITGAAGFIGMHICERLLARGDEVVGIDNLNDYYDVLLKQARLARLTPHKNFHDVRLDIADRQGMAELFARTKPDAVINLAAQAGVRYSLKNPHAYVDTNVVGFTNVLEGCRQNNVKHLVFASSSSVYGGNTRMPFSEHDNVDHPVSLYAATKKANELMAHSYSHLYGLPVTGLRFFTVYGPWGRPDMACFLFANAMLENRPIDVFNNGQMQRDFTYIDDVIDGLVRVLDCPPHSDPTFDCSSPDPAGSWAPYKVFNLGNRTPVALLDFIACLEKALGITAEKRFLPMQDGDVQATFADTAALEALIGPLPTTALTEGIRRFADWHRSQYHSGVS